MLTTLFSPIYSSSFTAVDYLLCTLGSLVLGALLAIIYSRLSKANPSYSLTLVMMPFVTQTVIMMVNGNIGTGIAVAGAFSFVRFRSMQYKAEDIIMIFIAVALGLATSIGYLGFATLFTLIVVVILLVFHKLFDGALSLQHKELRITVPESLNYQQQLDPVIEQYTSYCQLVNVRTSSMGSLYKLSYDIVLAAGADLQSFINELRIRNSNLEVSIGVFPEITEK